MLESRQCNTSTGTGAYRAKYLLQSWWIQGRYYFVAYTRPDKTVRENRLKKDVNHPEDQGQDLAVMLGAGVVAAWEKSWATLNYPEGELFLYFFHR